jgi:hypothetical protein
VFNERGLSAYILTLHPMALAVAAIMSAFLGLALFVLLGGKPMGRRVGLSFVLFVGCTILTHVVLSSLAGVDAIDVEVVRAR